MIARRRNGDSNLSIMEQILAGETVPWPGSDVRDEIAAEQYFDDRAQTPEARDLISATLARWLDAEIEIEVIELIKTRPGHRPPIWWANEAPEPRSKLGGIGDLHGDVYGRGGYPRYRLGLPAEEWITAELQRKQAALGMRVRGTPIDPADSPTFESQAAYLRRLDLLQPDEARRLTAADFEPETLAGW
jgi:hypothetical protein